MFGFIYYAATAGLLIACAAVLLDTQTRWLALAVVLFPLANVYIAGLGLLFIAATLAYRCEARRLPLSELRFVAILWGLWLAWVLAGFLAFGLQTRNLFQALEFVMYGAIAALLSALCRTTPRLVDKLLTACILAASLLSLVSLLALATTGWPATLSGRNESAFVIVVLGVLPLALQWSGLTRLPYRSASTLKVLLLFLIMIVATLALESRGSTLVASAVIASAALFRLSRRRLLPFLFLGSVTAFGALSVLATTGYLDQLMDTQVNFSNIERLNMLLASLRIFQESPWLGYGWGSGDFIFPFVPETALSYPHPHNTFARFCVELGIGGIAFLLLFFVRWVSRAVRLAQRGFRAESQWLLVVAGAVLALSMIDVIFYGASRAVPFIILFALTESLPVPTYAVLRSGSGEPEAVDESRLAAIPEQG